MRRTGNPQVYQRALVATATAAGFWQRSPLSGISPVNCDWTSNQLGRGLNASPTGEPDPGALEVSKRPSSAALQTVGLSKERPRSSGRRPTTTTSLRYPRSGAIHVDGPIHPVRLRVDLGHDPVVLGDPHRAQADRDAAGSGAEPDLVDELVRGRLDHPDRVRRDGGETTGATSEHDGKGCRKRDHHNYSDRRKEPLFDQVRPRRCRARSGPPRSARRTSGSESSAPLRAREP